MNSDGDVWGDACDNCPTVYNWDQSNGDGDAYGDACDGPGDFDHDGDVDLSDFASWAPCFTGPDPAPYPEGCEAFDFDIDVDVDLTDFAGFQRTFSENSP